MTSKNRIAPFKVVDIVKLELSLAVISKGLRSTIETKKRMSFNMVYHIVDNEIVKVMINKVMVLVHLQQIVLERYNIVPNLFC